MAVHHHTIFVEPHPVPPVHPSCRCVLLPVTELSDLGEDAPRPMENADFDAEAKRYYEQDHPGKHFDDLAQSTREQYRHKSIHRWEKETGRKAYTQVSGNMTFKDYFEQMSDQQKRDWLGKSKFAMWKSGKYEVSDFIPPYPDKAMTVKQLKAADLAAVNTNIKPVKDYSKWTKEQIQNAPIEDALEIAKRSKVPDDLIKRIKESDITEEQDRLVNAYEKASRETWEAGRSGADKKTIAKLKKTEKIAYDELQRFAEYQENQNMAHMAIQDHMGYDGYRISIPSKKHDTPEEFASLTAVRPGVDDVHRRFCRMISTDYKINGQLDYSLHPSIHKDRADYTAGLNWAQLKIHDDFMGWEVDKSGNLTGRELKKWRVMIGEQIHETGHCLEYNNKHIATRCKEFLAYRTKDCEVESMNQIWFDELKRQPEKIQELAKKEHPNGPYGLDEIAKRDKFYHGYTGKIYPDGATEVFSMGCQQLVEDPLGFYQTDPEYFRFILLLLRGEI